MTIPIHNWQELSGPARTSLLARPAPGLDPGLRDSVREILDAVREGGDAALRSLTLRFDNVALEQLKVDEVEFRDAEASLSAEAVTAIRLAAGNVRRFHEAQRPVDYALETMPGVRCERVSRPIDSVGLYVPAGTAPLPSAAIMLAVPAAIAGCPRRILCTPPRADGRADSAVLAAARIAGVTDVYKLGGAQAIAAMAWGTESVPKADKIFGPGNAWVTAAKSAIAAEASGPAIDMPAGPSEVMVIADAGASAAFVAADLLSQAEHGPDSQVLLLTTSRAFAGQVSGELCSQLAGLSRRDIAAAALEHSRCIVVDDVAQAIDICNDYAPEHLILQIADARSVLPLVRNAGSVFVGPWSPESAGDYCSGTNHVLPTAGAARCYSGLSVDQFMRQMTVQELSEDGLRSLSSAIATLAGLEGLDAHAAAVTRRVGREEGPDRPPADDEAGGIGKLLCPGIRGLKPYVPAAQVAGSVRLNANEAPRPLSAPLNRYPEIRPRRLHGVLAEHYGVGTDNLLATRGSSEAIDLLVRAFCRPGKDSIAISPPTFGMYRVYAGIQDVRIITAPLSAENGFALDVDTILDRCEAGTKLIFVCSPNNPTGTPVPGAAIRELAAARRGRSLIVVDEAYAEFCAEPSAIDALPDHDNVVVLRTLSKALSLAGVRCGAVLGAPELIAALDGVLAPYALATPVVDCVLDALSSANARRARAAIDTILQERERLRRELESSPAVSEVWPSQANFLLVRFRNRPEASAALRKARILVRDLSEDESLADCARITVGLPEENDLLLAALSRTEGTA